LKTKEERIGVKGLASMAARLARVPALHFAAVGALLFALQAGLTRDGTAPLVRGREPIVVSAARVEQLRNRFVG
jgi:hypothetical protein